PKSILTTVEKAITTTHCTTINDANICVSNYVSNDSRKSNQNVNSRSFATNYCAYLHSGWLRHCDHAW
ncbi:MAG: hypothetical protein ACK55I_48120, partial [bacterium]